MDEPTGAAIGGATTARRADEQSHPRRMTISDGEDGMLTLDLRYADIHWLVDACRQLAADGGPRPGGMLKVQANGTIYLVSAVCSTGSRAVVRIVNLYDPAEHVELSEDLIRVVAGLIEEFPGTHKHKDGE